VSAATATATFITIPLSHYCEKARWGLDRAALPYREEAHAPLLSRLATRRSDGVTVPVLVAGPVRVTDSTEILVHADSCRGGDVLYPRDTAQRARVDALEERFDQDLGTHVRRWAYTHLLPDKALLRDLWSRGVPKREAFFLPLIVPLARKLLRAGYKVTPASAGRSLGRIDEIFRDVDDMLSDGRQYLVGGRFTAADLTFAALAAPAVFPAQCRAVLPTLAQIPAEMRAEVLRLRATAAGRFVLRLYSQTRAEIV
jgi:glutathione S-transferase